MNNIIKIVGASMVAFLTLATTSCSNDEPLIFNPETAIAPKLTSTLNPTYVLEQEDADQNFDKFTFSAAEFGMSAAIEYTLEIALAADTNFGSAEKLWSGSTLEAEIPTSKLNSAILILNGETTVPTDLLIRVKSEIKGLSGPTGAIVNSVSLATKITPYSSDFDLTTLPRAWAIGNYCGWDFGKANQLHNYASDEILYEGIIDFDVHGLIADHKTGNFKLSGAQGWDDAAGNWGVETEENQEEEPQSITLYNSGSSKNITSFKKDRFYKFKFNKSTLELTKVASFNHIGIIGNDGKWGDTDDVIFKWNPVFARYWTDITLSGDDIKFRTNSNWNGINYGGNFEELTQGGDNMKVTAGNYRIYLHMSTSKIYAELNAKMYGVEEPTSL